MRSSLILLTSFSLCSASLRNPEEYDNAAVSAEVQANGVIKNLRLAQTAARAAHARSMQEKARHAATKVTRIQRLIAQAADSLRRLENETLSTRLEVEKVEEQTGAVGGELKKATSLAMLHAKQYNDVAFTTEELAAENLQVKDALNNNSQTMNDARTSYAEDEQIIEETEARLAADETNVKNKIQFQQHQLDRISNGMDEMEAWAHETTPMINAQSDALVQMMMWVNHLEGELMLLWGVLRNINVEETGTELTYKDMFSSVEAAELKSVGKPQGKELEGKPEGEVFGS